MDRTLIKDFWNCGDAQIIMFAQERALLNRKERNTVRLLLEECMTQEQASEEMGVSVRNLQQYWYSATDKLLNIPWVVAYAKAIRSHL